MNFTMKYRNSLVIYLWVVDLAVKIIDDGIIGPFKEIKVLFQNSSHLFIKYDRMS